MLESKECLPILPVTDGISIILFGNVMSDTVAGPLQRLCKLLIDPPSGNHFIIELLLGLRRWNRLKETTDGKQW